MGEGTNIFFFFFLLSLFITPYMSPPPMSEVGKCEVLTFSLVSSMCVITGGFLIMTEEQVCDQVVKWFEEYKQAMGLRVSMVKLVLINRRWGKQLRQFGPTVREVLERDARFSLMMNAEGGQNVAVRLGVTRAEAEKQRAAMRAMLDEPVSDEGMDGD